MNGSDFKCIIINTVLFQTTAFSLCCCAMLHYVSLLLKGIQTWGWITLALFPLIRQLWLTSAWKQMGGVMYEKRTRLRKRRAENWSRASWFCHHLPSFISFQSHIISFFLWKTKVGLKGIVHPKMKILSSLTHPQVWMCLFCWTHEDILKKVCNQAVLGTIDFHSREK